MLVVANGAFKSGSTWLFHILRHIIPDLMPLPSEYANRPGWNSTSIPPEQLANFLESIDYASTNYLCKEHLGKPIYRDLLLSYQNVFVFNIERDLRDVLVSAYFHFQRDISYKGTFRDFYWEKGRRVADDVRRYHLTWSIASPQIYTSSYKKLQHGFQDEVGSIAKFLGIELSQEKIEEIRVQTSLEELKKKFEGDKNKGFYRKGIVGDWKGYFDEQMLEDIVKIEANGLNRFDRLASKTLYGIRKYSLGI